MDAYQEKLLNRLRSFLPLEQEFHHRVWVENIHKLDKEDLDLCLALVHANYLIRGILLENICAYCVEHNIDLPSFSALIHKKSND